MEAAPAATGFTQATDFGPVAFHGNREPRDPAAILDGKPLERMTALHQRQLDIHATMPTHEEVSAASQVKIGHANRISYLTRHSSEGGFGLDAEAPQVRSEQRKLERAEAEFKRLTTLQETRTVRWRAVGQLDQTVTDWLLRGGIPGGCALEAVEDAPISELLTKADGGRIDAAVERYRHRLRELAADLHRVNSAPWPSSLAKAAAKELIYRLADQGQPILDGAIEHGQEITFAKKRLTSEIYNVANSPGAIGYVSDAHDAVGLIAWMFRDQLLAKINAGFDQIAEDKIALDERQRAEALATINTDMLAIERLECACIWHADAKGEVIDFRPTTSPQAVLGVRLVNVPRVAPAGSSHGYSWNTLGGGR